MMHYLLTFGLTVTAFFGVQAQGVSSVFQIQPSFRGSFPRTPCITVFDAANNSAAIVNDCSAGTQQRGFQYDSTSRQIKIFNNFCLMANQTNDGAKVFISSCVDGDARQTWSLNTTSGGTINWGQFLKLCLDLTDGNEQNGNQIQIWSCDFLPNSVNQNQEWVIAPLANPITEVVNTGAGASSICMAADNSDNGSPVFAADCTDTSALKVWKVPQPGHENSGSYQLAFGPDGTGPIKCLDVVDGVNSPGTKLQLWDCTDGPNQQWLPSTATIRWDGISQQFPMCVDLTDGVTTRGNQLQIWNCTGNANQLWADIAPPQTTT